MTERSEVSHAMSTEVPRDLISIAEAAPILGDELIGIAQKINVWAVRGVLMVSRRAAVEYMLRSGGLIPAQEWSGPDPA